MRRSRFAVNAAPVLVRDLSNLDIFLFDLRPASHSDDKRIAVERIRAVSNTGPYLFASHFICALVLTIHLSKDGWVGASSTFLLLGAIVVLAALSTLLNRQRTKAAPPHQVVRLWAVFAASLGILWCLVVAFGLADRDEPLSTVALASLIGAFGLTVAAFISIPALLAISYAVGVCALLLVSPDNELLGLLIAFGGCLLGASIFGARDALIAAGRQLRIEYQAKKATRFVAEFEQSGRGWFWETDADGALTYVSDQLAQDLKRPPSELLDCQFIHLLGTDPGESEGMERTLGFYLSSRIPFSDVTVKAKVADDIWWSLSGTAQFDEYGRFLGFSGIGTDLTERRRAEAEINKLARYDALTGLPNRTLMKITLEEALKGIQKQKTGCAVFLIDLDRFKNVNDTLGHPVGDALLREVAERLTSVIGQDGQVGRIGGDEFQAIFPSMDSEHWLGCTAQRLIDELSLPYEIGGQKVTIGASVGIAIARSVYQCVDALIRDADLALYSAKDDGRGNFKIFSPEMHSDAQERQNIELDLRGAIQRDEFRLLYQPIVNTMTEEVVAFEALIRWVQPGRPAIPTEVFISLAEECGLITGIGEWVLRTACEEAAQWPSQVRIAVNISPIQFANPNLVTVVLNALSTTGLDPNRLELEITEGVFLSDEAAVDETFHRLKSAGVRIALDDFGTGYSSLGYLKRAPLSKIKIDQSFVRGAAATGSTSEAILRSIISLAQSLNMDTTAEGVETHDDLRLIRELGCSQVQGYIFGKPMEAEEARILAQSVQAVAANGYENTRSPRHSLIRNAAMQWNGLSFPVRVRNISTGGTMVESSRNLPVDAPVQLDLPGYGSLGASVRWCQGNRIGLQFDRPFSLRRLAPQKAVVRQDAMLKPSYLGSETADDSPWAARNERLTPEKLRRGLG